MTPRPTEDWFVIKELTAGVFGLAEFGHFEEVISYLVLGSDQAVLIDTGMGFFSIKAEITKITDLPCSVLNTHSHFDHIGSNFEFSQISLFDHPANRLAASEGVAAEFLKPWITKDQLLGKIPAGFPDPYFIRPFKHANFFHDGDILNISSLSLNVLHTPGHSDDSVCFFEQQRGWLFSGDLIYDGPIYIEKNGGLSKYRRSITQIASLKEITKIFPSHNSFEFPLEKLKLLQNALDKISTVELEREVIIEGRLRLVPE